MDNFEYRPATLNASTVEMDGPRGFAGTAENVRSREWAREFGKRNLMSAVRLAREVEVDFNADYETMDALREAADADLYNLTPGTFVAQGEWKQRGYVLSSQPKGIHFGWVNTSLVIALLDGAWWRVRGVSLLPESTAPIGKQYKSGTGEAVRTEGAADEGLHALTIYGKSVQDGTPTPSSPIPVQVVAPINYLAGCDGESTGSYPFDHKYNTNPLVLSSVIPAGTTVVFSFDAVNNISTNFGIILIYADDSTSSTYTTTDGTIGRKSKQITLEKDMKACGFYSVNASLIVANLQLEIGSTATPYVPYGCIGLNCGGIQTPIDMDGNFLASLPDGTRDELNIDSAGAVTLTKRVGVLANMGSRTWWAGSTSTSNIWRMITNAIASAVKKPSVSTEIVSLLTDRYERNSASVNYTKVTSVSVDTNGNVQIYDPNYNTSDDVAAFKTAIAADNLYYPLATEQTINLTSITMPHPTPNGEVSITAAVTPTITAEWELAQHINLDYPHDYPYDYSEIPNNKNVNTGRLVPCKPRIIFYGPATDPEITLAGNKYKVTASIASGGRIEVDGREMTVEQITQGGTVTDKFADALRGSGQGGGEYIFEPIPPGNHAVTWDGTFGVDIDWYEEVGEPPWSQS